MDVCRPAIVATHANAVAHSQHLQAGMGVADVIVGDKRLPGESMESALEVLMIQRDVVEVGEEVGEDADADECQK